jgi:acetyltransferase-like isoleucine patch superfamily enzyme
MPRDIDDLARNLQDNVQVGAGVVMTKDVPLNSTAAVATAINIRLPEG